MWMDELCRCCTSWIIWIKSGCGRASVYAPLNEHFFSIIGIFKRSGFILEVMLLTLAAFFRQIFAGGIQKFRESIRVFTTISFNDEMQALTDGVQIRWG